MISNDKGTLTASAKDMTGLLHSPNTKVGGSKSDIVRDVGPF